MVGVIPHIHLFVRVFPQKLRCEVFEPHAAHRYMYAALPNRLRPCRAQHHQRKVLLGRGLHQLAAHPQVEHVHPLQLPVLRNGAAVPPHIEVSADERIHGLNELFVRGHMPLLQHLFQAFRLFRRVATRERFPKRAELALHIQELPFDGLRLGIAHLCAHKLDAQPLEDGRRVHRRARLRLLGPVPKPAHVPRQELAAVVAQDLPRDAVPLDAAPQRKQRCLGAGVVRYIPARIDAAAGVDERR